MILKAHRNKLSRVLKNNFIPEVLAILQDKGIKTNKGKSYSRSMISLVYNGKWTNEAIEDAIIEVYKNRLSKQAKMSAKLTELLDTKKPEAVTPGLN